MILYSPDRLQAPLQDFRRHILKQTELFIYSSIVFQNKFVTKILTDYVVHTQNQNIRLAFFKDIIFTGKLLQ